MENNGKHLFGKKISFLSKINFFKLSLSAQVVISIFAGLLLGIILRQKPDLFSIIGVNAMSFQHLGNLFIKLIKMTAMPLIFSCIMSSVISLCRKASTGKTTLLTLIVFAIMTVVCISVGSCFAIFFHPGSDAVFDKTSILEQYGTQQENLSQASKSSQISVAGFLFNIVPSNIFVSIFAIGISRVDKHGNAYNGIKTLSQICMEVVGIVMRFAPFGTFGISTWLIATQDINLLKSLGKLVCVDWLCALFTIYVIYSLIVIFILRLNPIHLWKKLFSTQLMAFLTASSAATLPSGMVVAKEKLGMSEEKVDFVAPFSAAINSSGGGMYFAIMTIFMAQLFDINLSNQQYITLFIMCALCDLGVAPVPSGSLIMLGIDRVLDMARTLMNYTGDIFSAFIVDRLSKTLNVQKYKAEKKRFIFF